MYSKELLNDIRNMLSERNDTKSLDDRFPGVTFGDGVDVGIGVTIGQRSNISDNVFIGDFVMVASGSTISKNVSIPSNYTISKNASKLIKPISRKKLDAIEKFFVNFKKKKLQRRFMMNNDDIKFLQIDILDNSVRDDVIGIDYTLLNHDFDKNDKIFKKNGGSKQDINMDIPINSKFLTFDSILSLINKKIPFDVPVTLDDIEINTLGGNLVTGLKVRKINNDEGLFKDLMEFLIYENEVNAIK